MKKINIILIILLVGGVFACDDFLEQSPSTSLPSDEAITSVDDLTNAVNGVYAMLVYTSDLSSSGQYQYTPCGDFTLYADLKGDDAYYPKNSNHITPLARYDHDETSDHAEGFYAVFYKALGQVNDVLKTAEGLTVADADKDTYNDFMGQLHALRGYLHFNLAILYAQIPTVTGVSMDAANSGIPISDEVFATDYKASRSTLTETYNFITTEFKTAIDLLSSDKSDGKMNKWAAEALLARTYLYLGDYNNALQYANDVIQNASNYRLYTIDEYPNVWSEAYSVESLFELTTSDTYNAQRYSIGYYTDLDGYGECGALESFYNYMQSDANDVRSQLVILKTDDSDLSAYCSNKYPGQSGVVSPLYVNNPKIIRMSEVYLIAAEAAVNGGTATGAETAVSYYNTLRKNRISNYTDATSVTLNDVLAEYRKELNFEGHRFFDLVRNNITFTNNYVGEISSTNNKVIVAIPQREIDISGADVLIQNPGY